MITEPAEPLKKSILTCGNFVEQREKMDFKY